MKITEQQARDFIDGDVSGYKEVEQSKWITDGDQQHQTIVFERLEDNTFWELWWSRDGSPYSDWYFEYADELVQVKQIETIVKKWVSVV